MKTLLKFSAYISIFSILISSCTQNQRVPERNIPYRARNSNEPMKKVFVLPFVDVENKKPKNVLEGARRVFISELLRTGEFVVIKNSDFPKDFETYKGGQEKNYEYDLEKIAELSQGQGVNGVVEGQILDIKTKRVGDDVGLMRKIRVVVDAQVRIRAFSIEGKKEIFDEVRTATIETTTTRFAERGYNLDLDDDPALINEAVQKAFQGLVPPLASSMRKLTWSGRIAMVRGEKIYINAGRVSGIQVGDLLKVLDQGQDVFDPQTGTLLGRAEGRMKGTIEIVSYFGKDGSIGVIHSGADFRENDRVELY